MKYIDYHHLNEFYPIKDLCKLFEMEKRDIKGYCNEFHLEPERINGLFGFKKHNVRKLHNFIYQKDKDSHQTLGSSCRKEDPWND